MKKKTIIILSIIAVLLLSLTAVAVWQWENIQAVYLAVRYDREDIEALEKQNNEIMNSIVEKFSEEGISALPEEAVQMIYEGNLTEEEAVSIITGTATIQQIKENHKNPSPTQAPAASGNATTANPNVAALVAKIYMLRGDFVGRLDALVSQGYAEYKAGGSKKALASKYLSMGASLESQCDAQMNSILSQIEAELKKSGGDLSLVSQIRSAYRSEKSAKKAAIMSMVK